MDNKIGTRVRELRISQNLTMLELSKLIDVSYSFMGLIERNQRTPGIKNIAKLCGILNVSYDYLIIGKETNFIVDNRDAL
ncbi:MAG: helix-turn-helix domain-containing protein [Defluviitaleaceae bacterium]|nr:helix-turn-helix domain-containing protein [Defluviitaleaceae bacterium]MCL2836586.1 helix-turn-helix domain-containing protein [Defluviitaleaceae bacterium]